jgi:4-carboxymuconolactone decarboxylase
MAEGDTRLEKGLDMFETVYGGQLPRPPSDTDFNPFQRLMMENLFGDVWSREAMSVRDRRLIVIGCIAALAPDPTMLIDIQIRAALARGELTRDQLREIPVILTQYVGYPRTVPVMMAIEAILQETGKA